MSAALQPGQHVRREYVDCGACDGRGTTRVQTSYYYTGVVDCGVCDGAACVLVETRIECGRQPFAKVLPECDYCGGAWVRTGYPAPGPQTVHVCTEAGIAAAEREDCK